MDYYSTNPGTLEFISKCLLAELPAHSVIFLDHVCGVTGWPGKRAYVRIHIHVADHNDHAPEFLQSSFEGKVFESAALGTSVVQTTAVDKDRGDNARISYSIVSGESSQLS